MKEAKREDPASFVRLRGAVEQQLQTLGGARAATDLFMLAADMATTAEVRRGQLSTKDQQTLRQLWNDLRSQ